MIHFKVVLVGSSNSGKTSIIQRYVNNQFNMNLCPTVQAGYFEKSLSFDNREISLEIWDTAGQERFHSITPIYYRDAAAGIIVFDVTDINSFSKSKQWVSELRNTNPSIYLIMIGNKLDLQAIRVVSNGDAVGFCEENGITYFEGSAKTGMGINEIFCDIGLKLSESKAFIDASSLCINENKNKGCC